jgi:UDP-N-acetylmuramoyl-tripeptide--D-alanyl-D-alanine ligase
MARGTTIPDNRASFSLGEVAASCAGSVVGASADTTIHSVCTDTRALRQGCLFVALRGEQHDGHRFVREALSRGAAAALVEDAATLGNDGVGVVVADTLRALGELGRVHRRRWGGRVVAVTGSSGKTTTKELAHAALVAAGVRADKTRGNLNNLIGAPMTLLALEPDKELVVLEIGTNARGEIARLAEIAEPETGVVTSVSVAHSAGIGTLEQVAEEKASLLSAVPATGTAIYSADHAVLAAHLKDVRARRRLSFGAAKGSDVRLVRHTFALDPTLRMRCEFALETEGRALHSTLSCLGEGPALDAAAALAVVLAERGPDALDAAARGLEGVLPTAGRLSPCFGPSGALVLDDSYNANPASMVASIHTAIELAQARGGRALLVVGDMRELGALSRAEHERVGRAAAHPVVSALIACGIEMTAGAEAAREAARDAGLSLSISHLADPAGAAHLLSPILRQADVVLVKGSRSMAMEQVARALCAGGREAA